MPRLNSVTDFVRFLQIALDEEIQFTPLQQTPAIIGEEPAPTQEVAALK